VLASSFLDEVAKTPLPLVAPFPLVVVSSRGSFEPKRSVKFVNEVDCSFFGRTLAFKISSYFYSFT
jgi:hypothetical protein